MLIIEMKKGFARPKSRWSAPLQHFILERSRRLAEPPARSYDPQLISLKLHGCHLCLGPDASVLQSRRRHNSAGALVWKLPLLAQLRHPTRDDDVSLQGAKRNSSVDGRTDANAPDRTSVRFNAAQTPGGSRSRRRSITAEMWRLPGPFAYFFPFLRPA